LSDSLFKSRIERHIAEVPFNVALGIRYAGHGDNWLENMLEWRQELADEPGGGCSPGVIASLVDATCGAAVLVLLDQVIASVTLNLQVDFVRPSEAARSVRARAECTHLGDQIALVRATVHDGDPARPIGFASAKFLFERLS